MGPIPAALGGRGDQRRTAGLRAETALALGSDNRLRGDRILLRVRTK